MAGSSRCGSHRRPSFEHFFVSDSNTFGHHSFNAPNKAFDALLLNSITSKFFTILQPLTIFRLQRIYGTFILLALACPQASALIGAQRSEGIDIVAYGPDDRWGECRMLMVPPDTRIRISYPFQHEQRTREIVFPANDPSVPTLHLGVEGEAGLRGKERDWRWSGITSLLASVDSLL